MIRKILKLKPLKAALVLAAGLLAMASEPATAVPSYARQTGENCHSCHISFPELTPFGRYFKLSGYTLGKWTVPLAMMGQIGVTSASSAVDNTGEEVVPRNNNLVFSGASLFVAGKVNDNVGAFIQWSYDNLAHHSALDNTDIRAVGRGKVGDKELIYGFTLHNNPTVQDVWNSTPAFGFPYTSSPVAVTGTPVSALIDGGLAQQVAGLGGYFYWNKSIYGELSLYRTADGIFSALRAGQDTVNPGGVSALNGYNPYWRLAYNHEWGAHSLMVGTYGMRVEKYPDNTDPTTPTDRFTDTALDAQYQYITDPHTFTFQTTWIHEKQDWNASFPFNVANGGGINGVGPTPANPSDTLNTFKAKATYYYRHKYGATLGYFSTTGSSDAGLYDVLDATTGLSVNGGTPDTRGYILELDYLPIERVRLMLQYTAYQKFQGASSNIDGNGRNPRDNNSLFFNVWFAF